jgi:subtilisin-like proprotein convertase family protein
MTPLRSPVPPLLALLVLGAGAAACGGGGGSAVSSIAVTPEIPGGVADAAAGGAALPLMATATYSDGGTADVTLLATWTSSDRAQVAVEAGSATAPATAGIGNAATITATLSGVSGTLVVTVVRGPRIGVALGNDPLASQEWYLANTGQACYADRGGTAGEDLRLATAHRLGLTGAGVTIAIVDSGLEIAHEDLAANVIAGGGWNFIAPGSSDPTPPVPPPADLAGGDHGTSVSGIIAMVYDNGKGGMGIAPGARLKGFNPLADKTTDVPRNYALSLGAGSSAPGPVSNDAWIFNQSYGDDGLTPARLDSTMADAYEYGITSLRNGLGALYTKSAGNGFQRFWVGETPEGVTIWAPCDDAVALGVSCQNPNMEEASTLPANIVVGALNASGIRSSYSSAGSAIWVSTPGGEFGMNRALAPYPDPYPEYRLEPAMVTTDRSGCSLGYAVTGAPTPTSYFNRGEVAENASCNYTNRFNGTSSAAPSLAGAIALLLDARPSLTWRDVKHILAMTARKVDPTRAAITTQVIPGGTYEAELPWTQNKAGRWFHNWYGFGAVDVDAAVAMAASYTPLGSYQITSWIPSSDPAATIPDNSVAGVTSTITIPAGGPTAIEVVQIELDLVHEWASDLAVELTGPGPGGTRSILLNVRNGLGAPIDMDDFVLASNAFYGESPVGTWTLKIVDGRATRTGTLRGWSLRIHGH